MPSDTRPSTTRQQVTARLKVALELALADGGSYADLDVSDLAARAGLSRSSFYVYFDSKVDLIRELAGEVIAAVVDVGDHWWDLPADATRDDLHQALHDMLTAYRDHAPLAGALAEAAAYDRQVRESYEMLSERFRNSIEQHIRDGQATGRVRRDLDPDIDPHWLTGMMSRGSHELLRTATRAQFDRRLDALADLLWSVLYEDAG